MTVEEMIETLQDEAFHNMPAMTGDAVVPRYAADKILAKLKAAEELAEVVHKNTSKFMNMRLSAEELDATYAALKQYREAGK